MNREDMSLEDDDFDQARRELDDACREAGVTVGGVRAPGGLTARGLRAIADVVREGAGRRGVPSRPTVMVRVVDGDILSMEADAIVNPWNRNYWPRRFLAPGGLSGKLKERTTDVPWRELANLGMLRTGEVVVTDAGELPGYRLLFHAVGLTFGWKATVEGVAECARNVVRRAIERDVRSVAVPLIGAGRGKLTAEASEAAILAGLSDVARIVDDAEQADIVVTVVRLR